MNNTYTIGSTLSWLEKVLENAGDNNPRLSAQLLMCNVMRMNRANLYINLDQELTPEATNKVRDFATRRCAHEPVQYIIGRADFMGNTFKICPGVLIPRPETEVLVEECIKYLKINSVIQSGGYKKDKIFYCVDLCTGSGNIAASIVKNYQNTKFLAVDISEEAVNCALRNIDRFKLNEKISVLQGDLEQPIIQKFPGSKGKIDLVVSNPPYVPTAVYEKLPDEVAKYEPKIALEAGADGLDFYKRIVRYAKNALRPGGMMAVELHEDSLNKAKQIAIDNGFKNVTIVNDLTYRPRVLSAIR